jgi:hypothetical protein
MCSRNNKSQNVNQLRAIFALMAEGRVEGLAEFGLLYEDTIRIAIKKLSGIHDVNLVENTVVGIITKIWRYSKLLLTEERPSILIYKFILLYVFRLLEQQGMPERIQHLKRISPMDATAFESFPFV